MPISRPIRWNVTPTLVARIAARPGVALEVIGQTLDGQDLDMLTIGEPGDGKRVCWAIARQHPGETMAEWWMEGFLDRLTDADDPVARALRESCVFHVVPNMNPDGSRRGHLRTNAVGANLNREWLQPSAERSPEVLAVRERMHATGVDFCLDVHGDEELPYNFIAGFEGIPSITGAQLKLLSDFKTALAAFNPDFQTVHGYGRPEPGKANLAMCTNYVAETFGCLAMTLEMPFKDTADTPNAETGWSPDARQRWRGHASMRSTPSAATCADTQDWRNGNTMITVYGISNCDTCRKALKWLKERDVEHRFVDLRKDGLSTTQVEAWLDAVGLDVLVNKRGTTWRKLDDATKDSLSPQTAPDLLVANPTLIKRPVFELPDGHLVGFSKAQIEALERRLG